SSVLDSRASSTLGAFSVSSPDATSNFSTSVTAYDSLGNDHSVNIYFRNNGDNATDATRTDWQWRAVVGASDSASGSAEIQASGTLTFTSGGALYSESAITSPLASGGFDFASGAAAGQAITFDFGTTIAADSTTGFAGTTQFGAASSTVALTQDGYSSGSLKSVTIAPTGVVTGIFTNGQSRDISQIVLAKFAAPTELTKLGENLFASSSASGQAVVNAPGGSGVGSVVSNTLELSNVDLAQEFVKMIVNQRGFQANSRIITVSDELLSEVVNLKR
nr:flagellar hook-basal body complex protein [Candidatus Brocadiales bacterium]